jgi:hypothetical protein
MLVFPVFYAEKGANMCGAAKRNDYKMETYQEFSQTVKGKVAGCTKKPYEFLRKALVKSLTYFCHSV